MESTQMLLLFADGICTAFLTATRIVHLQVDCCHKCCPLTIRLVEQWTKLLWLYVFSCPLQHNSCSPEDNSSAAGVVRRSWMWSETEMLWAVLLIQFCSSREWVRSVVVTVLFWAQMKGNGNTVFLFVSVCYFDTVPKCNGGLWRRMHNKLFIPISPFNTHLGLEI